MAHPYMSSVGELVAQCIGHSRLPNPCLTGDEHGLALPAYGPVPALEQHPQFVFAPDEGTQIVTVQRFESTCRNGLASHFPGVHETVEPLKRVFA